MARSLDETKDAIVEEKSKYSKDDAELATRLGIQMLNEGQGLKVIESAMAESKDPAQAIGAFLAQMMGSLAEQLKTQANVDPGIFLAKGGFLENILNYIEQKLGLPPEFSDQVYPAVLETIKAAAMNPPAQGGPGAPPQGAPAPQGPAPAAPGGY